MTFTVPKVFEDFYAPKRYKVAYGGRGSGKSWAFALMALRLASVNKGLLFVCLREIQNSIEDSVYRLLSNLIHDAKDLDSWTITRTEISHKVTGSRFIFKGLYRNLSSLKSLEGADIAWIEEAQSVSQESLDFLIPTIRKEGSELWFTFNPDQEDDPVYKTFILEGREEAVVKKVNYYNNPYFPETLRKEMEFDRAHDPDKYAWVWEGNCRQVTDAQIFKGKFFVEDFFIPSDAQFNQGIDFGFAQDPTAAVRCYVKEGSLYVSHEAWGLGVETDHIKELTDQVPDWDKWVTIGDSARPETISFLKRQGMKIKGAKKGKGSVEDGIEKIRSFKKIIIHPRCKKTFEEFRLYSYKVNKHTGEITPVPEDRNNHIIDALRYSLEKRTKTVKMLK